MSAIETDMPEPTDASATDLDDAAAGGAGAEPTIDRLWPGPAADLDDAALLDAYAFPGGRPWLRMNFIASLDGAATRAGRSGGLGDAADRRVFDLLRWGADAVLVGAGTVRTEGYGAMVLPDAAVAWRLERGLTAQPRFVIVSRSAELDPSSPVFADAPVIDGRRLRPTVVTVAQAPGPVGQLAKVAEILVAGETAVDLAALPAELAGRGMPRVHAEGGPSLFGDCIAAGIVDELCMTLAPSLEAGDAPRIAHTPTAASTGMALAHVLRAGDELLLRYRRA